MTPDEMRVRARQYRAMATVIDDAQAHKALHDLADEYEALAEKTEKPLPNEGSQEE
jgi:hypothetical protein